jgi:GNAT superfamily N-acetyltransferase
MSTGYPSQWEADVVMTDGGTGQLRPIQPEDAERLVAFHNRLSAETIRYRFFAPHPTLSPAEVEDFTQVDHDQRVALVAVLGEDLVAVGRYDRIPGTDVAEVAFVVDDAQLGRGWGSVLLEHLAAIASERGVRRFEADVLTDNVRMVPSAVPVRALSRARVRTPPPSLPTLTPTSDPLRYDRPSARPTDPCAPPVKRAGGDRQIRSNRPARPRTTRRSVPR